MSKSKSVEVGDKILFSVELLNQIECDGRGPVVEGIQKPNTRVVRVCEIREHAGFKEIWLEVIEP